MHALFRRYEDLLEYPQGFLQCTADLLNRQRVLVRSEPVVPRDRDDTPDVDPAQQLLERALSTQPMTGLDWYTLSGSLGRNSNAILVARDWQALLDRCTQEMAVSLNLEFALRDEAADSGSGRTSSSACVQQDRRGAWSRVVT